MANTSAVARSGTTKSRSLKSQSSGGGTVAAAGWTDLPMRGLNPMLKAVIALYGMVPQVNFGVGQIRVKNGETMRLAKFDKIFGTNLAAKIH